MSKELQAQCIAKAEEMVQRVNSVFKTNLNVPKLTFDLRGRSAGCAYYGIDHIKINPIIMKENPDHIVNVTVGHEVAHLAANKIFKTRGHDRTWKHVMCKIGLDPKRTHNLDVSNATVRKITRMPVKCSCRTHMISSIMINRMKKGTVSYSCKFCGECLHAPTNRTPA